MFSFIVSSSIIFIINKIENDQFFYLLASIENLSSLSVRFIVYKVALLEFISNPIGLIFGMGPDFLESANSISFKALDNGYSEGTVDSGLISYLIELGLINFCLLIYFIFKSIKKSYKDSIKNLINNNSKSNIPLYIYISIIFLLIALSTQMLGYTKTSWFPFQLILIGTLYKFNKKNMNNQFLKILKCPKSGQSLILKNNLLFSEDEKYSYPIDNEIPRFVPKSNYADNFGMQWNHFSRTQLDSYTNIPISSDRFWVSTNWNPDDMKGKWVLDVGCGAGRFAEVALKAGAYVVALDYSSSVDACKTNLSHFENLFVVQGDIYKLPFADKTFDYVYSLGVLQHTPDVKLSFDNLVKMVKNNGKFCVDFYQKSFFQQLLPKYWLRPITKKIPQQKLFNTLIILIPLLLFLSRVLSRVPLIGKILKRIIPVANYEYEFPFNYKQLKEWALLDTFDWLAPEYDNPQTNKTVTSWINESGLKDIKVLKVGHLVARGQKK